MEFTKLWYLLSLYLTSILLIFRYLKSGLFSITRNPTLITFMDKTLSLYFHLCDLCPCTIDLNDQTTIHFWTTNHRKLNKPNLLMIHGFGGTSRWQFIHQVGTLSRKFNLYIPDLLFFGKSYSAGSDFTDVFQTKCILEGLKRLGVDRGFSVYAISYGGFVAYRMAEMCGNDVEKVVIVSSGIGCDEGMKERHLKEIGRNDVSGIFVPETPKDMRLLVKLSMFHHDFIYWVPDFVLCQFIKVMLNACRKEKIELVQNLISKGANPNIPKITQETLIIWGDKDNVFPIEFAHQLYRHLGPKSRLAIIKDTGHAVNMESPHELNRLIQSFVLGVTPSLMSDISCF